MPIAVQRDRVPRRLEKYLVHGLAAEGPRPLYPEPILLSHGQEVADLVPIGVRDGEFLAVASKKSCSVVNTKAAENRSTVTQVSGRIQIFFIS